MKRKRETLQLAEASPPGKAGIRLAWEPPINLKRETKNDKRIMANELQTANCKQSTNVKPETLNFPNSKQ